MNSFIQKSFQWFSIKLFSNLFIIWFLLLPFDAQLLPLDLGIITIYPELILTFLLLFGSFILENKIQYPTSNKLFQLFFLIWMLYAIGYYPFLNGKYEALHEIRSLILMSATIILLIRTPFILGKSTFIYLISQLSFVLFLFLAIIGFLEFFTGIHFAGYFTEKLVNLPAGSITYAPVFLYDNPNNFLVYLFSFGCIHLLTNQNISTYKLFSIFLLLTFFSIAADSKFGKISSLLLFIFHFTPIIWAKIKSVEQIWLRITFFLFISVLICILSKPLFWGPIWKDNQKYLLAQINPLVIKENKATFINRDSLVQIIGEDSLYKSFSAYREKGIVKSVDLRRNLILNGLYLTKFSNYLGVGPGQFQWYHSQNLVPYSTNKISNPHESNIEIASQYGVFIYLLFVSFMLFKIFSTLNSILEIKKKVSYLAICISYLIVSDMPSSWLVLNIAWAFTAILFLFPDLILKTSNEIAE